MKTDQNLEDTFFKTVDFVNNFTDPLPADLLLKLYAFYKIASENKADPGSKTPLINAFKANALIQAKNLSKKQAMESYIALVNKELKEI
ncbi:acyl-CoA-binding protein [Cellulophaga sp. HaHaR_3_176]|uniref:acyl-CoA-binding protein n=1 Tax=Cellulophaga sp. HaHaR_3_176 TaxID=1942464 RepID=UPI001C1F4F2A|nr:acyl-CoA-binding protein [Cellulophaga sp. HaHaR_3_176]QWX84377.1 acyl-CoA-binding protein [Cellulophaga sp. HaHaR_3_176]